MSLDLGNLKDGFAHCLVNPCRLDPEVTAIVDLSAERVVIWRKQV